ncbi:MAG: DUF1993 domain-containing protein [Pseudomonadales bacterium]|nr:DUF1993 domain-containing protein [Pseudomonadales bacterium]
MSISLHRVSIGTYVQILDSITVVLKKGLAHCKKNDVDPNTFLEAQIHPDMLPLTFQITSVVHHSLGAIKGAEASVFSTPVIPELDYEGFQKLIEDTAAELKAYSVESIEALEGGEVQFKMGGQAVGKPFKSEDFILKMSLPNFYFHAATTYDILRLKGVALGKMDFLGSVISF